METQGKKQFKFVVFLMFGALFSAIMVAVTKLIGADEYTGMFAIATVGFAIVTIPFSVVIEVKPKKKSVSRVDLLREQYFGKETVEQDR